MKVTPSSDRSSATMALMMVAPGPHTGRRGRTPGAEVSFPAPLRGASSDDAEGKISASLPAAEPAAIQKKVLKGEKPGITRFRPGLHAKSR